MRQKHITNIKDFKSPQNEWVKSYTVATPELQTVYHTRSSILWRSMIARCYSESKGYESWKDCEVHFDGYQDFTDWCQNQFGYMHQEDGGKFWAIDKDLMVEGNRIYSPEFCVFVSMRVNNLFNFKNRDNGYPCGVSRFNNCKNLYRWSCGDGKSTLWGSATDPFTAHRGWQNAKINIIENLLITEDYGNKLKEIITDRLNKLKYEFQQGIETKHYRFQQKDFK